METANNHRPWEAERMNLQSQGPQTLPSISTLTQNITSQPSERSPLNLPLSAVSRDSDSWSTPQSSMPTSSTFCGSAAPFSNTSPNRYSGTPHSSDLSAGPQPSPGFTSSTQGQQQLPSLNQTFDPVTHRGSGDFEEVSRRSSMDSRVHLGMDKLALGATSPYASTNASQSSLKSGLQRERGIQTNGTYRGPRYSGGPISPIGPRGTKSGFAAGRVAPPIMENPRSDIYHAPEPTAGRPYAFPDPDVRPERPGSQYSRRGSFADSFTSSLYTTDSRLPPGQQGNKTPTTVGVKPAELFAELPDANTHHHKLQNKHVQGAIEEGDSPNSNTPYSRTPELRVTHKLAERKRRSEMKGCFESLRQRLPVNHQTNKSSKGETLQRAIEYITSLETQNGKYQRDTERLNQQLAEMDLRMKDMTAQIQRLQQQQASPSYDTPPPTGIPSLFGNHGGQFGNGQEPPRTLPPLMNGAAMQGVQYADERR